MLRLYWNYLAVLAGAAAVLAVGITPAAATPAVCPGGRVAAFEAPDVTLAPEPNSSFTVWSSPVTVLAFCEDLNHPEDVSVPLGGATVSAVSLFNSSGIADLTISVSTDGNGGFVATPPGVTTIMTSGITSDSAGNATFIMRAQSTNSSFLGNSDGTPKLIGMHFDINLPDMKSTSIVLPDEGFVFAQTPELDSVVLFGSGALGLAGYALVRMRARRRN
jgi:hypothetical protein